MPHKSKNLSPLIASYLYIVSSHKVKDAHLQAISIWRMKVTEISIIYTVTISKCRLITLHSGSSKVNLHYFKVHKDIFKMLSKIFFVSRYLMFCSSSKIHQ